MAQVHYLKTWPVYFDAVRRGDKTFEVRRDDRGFQKGDFVVLQRTQDDREYEVELDDLHKPALGERHRARHEIVARIRYVLTGGQFGIEPGYVVLELSGVDASGTVDDVDKIAAESA